MRGEDDDDDDPSDGVGSVGGQWGWSGGKGGGASLSSEQIWNTKVIHKDVQLEADDDCDDDQLQ